MPEFYKHQILFSLQPDLNVVVADWVSDLIEKYIYEDAYALFEDLRQAILSTNTMGLDAVQIGRIRNWLNNTPVKSVVAALVDRGGWGRSSKTPPKATVDQIRIIEEAQREVGLDFSRFFSDFTTWEADAVIKGCVAVSEVQRQTGDRHFALKDLRAAVRNHVLYPPVVVPRGRIVEGNG